VLEDKLLVVGREVGLGILSAKGQLARVAQVALLGGKKQGSGSVDARRARKEQPAGKGKQQRYSYLASHCRPFFEGARLQPRRKKVFHLVIPSRPSELCE
jgi:hypothetical protein